MRELVKYLIEFGRENTFSGNPIYYDDDAHGHIFLFVDAHRTRGRDATILVNFKMPNSRNRQSIWSQNWRKWLHILCLSTLLSLQLSLSSRVLQNRQKNDFKSNQNHLPKNDFKSNQNRVLKNDFKSNQNQNPFYFIFNFCEKISMNLLLLHHPHTIISFNCLTSV